MLSLPVQILVQIFADLVGDRAGDGTFGGVGHEVGGDLGTMYVPGCLANALYDYKDDSTRASDPAVAGRLQIIKQREEYL